MDVTDQLRGILGDRIPELLAIVVNHSLGTQTLELTSVQFEERARRLQALTVRQTEDLIVDACIDGSAFKVTLGEVIDRIRANNAGCLDQCEHGITVVVYPEQVWYGHVTVADIPEIVDRHLLKGELVERLMLPEQPHLDGATTVAPLPEKAK